jgi:uncharacterized membrane protein
MPKENYNSMIFPVRIFLGLFASLLLLGGCGSDDKKEDKKDDEDKKPAYERVVILKERFDQLENSLDEMERDLQLQKKRIESTRETAKSIKRSLLKGNLKGYSLDTISTDPMVLRAVDKRIEKDQEKEAKEDAKEENDDLILNSLLIILFVIFIIIIFIVALRDRNQGSPYDNTNTGYPDSDLSSDPADTPADDNEPETGGSYEYGRPNDLLPGGGDESQVDQDPDNQGPRP